MASIQEVVTLYAEQVPPAYTDEALALRFADEHGERLRYVAAWNKWYIWGGTHWRPDDTLSAFNDARKICRAASAECNKARQRSAIASAKTVAATLGLARADRRLAATVDQWDANDWLLSTPAGTVDLRTGEQRAHQPGDYITKLTAVAPGGTCPAFLRFLAEVTDEDIQLQAFLQRLLGYALTGSTREHGLFFLHGLGANGKSVFVSTVAGREHLYDEPTASRAATLLRVFSGIDPRFKTPKGCVIVEQTLPCPAGWLTSSHPNSSTLTKPSPSSIRRAACMTYALSQLISRRLFQT